MRVRLCCQAQLDGITSSSGSIVQLANVSNTSNPLYAADYGGTFDGVLELESTATQAIAVSVAVLKLSNSSVSCPTATCNVTGCPSGYYCECSWAQTQGDVDPSNWYCVATYDQTASKTATPTATPTQTATPVPTLTGTPTGVQPAAPVMVPGLGRCRRGNPGAMYVRLAAARTSWSEPECWFAGRATYDQTASKTATPTATPTQTATPVPTLIGTPTGVQPAALVMVPGLGRCRRGNPGAMYVRLAAARTSWSEPECWFAGRATYDQTASKTATPTATPTQTATPVPTLTGTPTGVQPAALVMVPGLGRCRRGNPGAMYVRLAAARTSWSEPECWFAGRATYDQTASKTATPTATPTQTATPVPTLTGTPTGVQPAALVMVPGLGRCRRGNPGAMYVRLAAARTSWSEPECWFAGRATYDQTASKTATPTATPTQTATPVPTLTGTPTGVQPAALVMVPGLGRCRRGNPGAMYVRLAAARTSWSEPECWFAGRACSLALLQ